jgi:hypothetical protein
LGAHVTMDRAYTIDVPPADVWPWLVQIGKHRAGWYFPRWIERLIPAGRRGARRLDPRFDGLEVGQTIADWGGRGATLTVTEVSEPARIVFASRRGHLDVGWTLELSDLGGRTGFRSVVRVGPVRHRWLAEYGGGLFDWFTIWGLVAGLRERLAES